MRKVSGSSPLPPIMKQVSGWLLLILGALIIIWTIWSSYEIFTDKKPVPEIFKIQKEQEGIGERGGGLSPTEEQIQQVIKEQIGTIIPLDFIPKLFNLISWSIFAGILIFAGGKLSTLGIKLLTK